MNPERWARIEALYEDVLALPRRAPAHLCRRGVR
jgi:hypothetical protein